MVQKTGKGTGKKAKLVCGHTDKRPALSRYGHGDICSACGQKEAMEGDFLAQAVPEPREVSVPKQPTAVVVHEQEEKMSVEKMISLAITEKVPVETMERILAMRRELKAEWAKAEYDKAMAAFQAECPIIEKTKEVKTNSGDRAYKYAPIESIVKQVAPILQKHGFSYSTSMELKETGVRVIVKVTHAAGHSTESPMEVPFGTKTQIMSQTQVAAAAQTFAKRYAFCNAFGILTGDEDNDGKTDDLSREKPQAGQSTPPQGRKKLEGPQTEKQLNMINALISKKGVDREKVKEYYKVESLKDLNKDQSSELIDTLTKKPDAPVEGEGVIEAGE